MRQKVLGNRGFTLIELLAVITILAIIMLFAATNVTTVLSNSQKKAFVIDAQSILETAKLAYTDALLNNRANGNKFCMSVDYLKKNGYLEKLGSDISGSVLVDGSGASATYKIWYTNGKYTLSGFDASTLDPGNPPSELTGTNSTNCSGEGVTLTNQIIRLLKSFFVCYNLKREKDM